MLNKKLSVTIKNNVNKKLLLNALEKHFGNDFNIEILTVYVFEDNCAHVVEFDGISVTKWLFKDVYELINCSILDSRYNNYEIVFGMF